MHETGNVNDKSYRTKFIHFRIAPFELNSISQDIFNIYNVNTECSLQSNWLKSKNFLHKWKKWGSNIVIDIHHLLKKKIWSLRILMHQRYITIFDTFFLLLIPPPFEWVFKLFQTIFFWQSIGQWSKTPRNIKISKKIFPKFFIFC